MLKNKTRFPRLSNNFIDPKKKVRSIMKTLVKILTSRAWKFTFMTIFFLSTCLMHNYIYAQYQGMIAKLTEAEIRTVIPILKAEAAQYTNYSESTEKLTELKYQLFLDIQSGKTDPLEWLKQRTKRIIVPPGAIYLPDCSREESIKGWEVYMEDKESGVKPTAVPTAIFTFGKDFPAINKHLLGDNITNESYNKFTENPYDATNPSFEKMRSFIKDADSFYTKNGFSIHYSDFLPVATAFSFSHPADEGLIPGFLNMFDWTFLDPSHPDVLKQCRSNIMGPVIEIRASYELLDKVLGSLADNNLKDENKGISLKKAGITEDRYALIVNSLLMVRRDSENPEGIEVPSLDFTPTTREEKELAKVVETMRHDALARKDNVKLYNKFKTELDPILDILEKYMGGQ